MFNNSNDNVNDNVTHSYIIHFGLCPVFFSQKKMRDFSLHFDPREKPVFFVAAPQLVSSESGRFRRIPTRATTKSDRDP